jgi:sulfate transport system permease protein
MSDPALPRAHAPGLVSARTRGGGHQHRVRHLIAWTFVRYDFAGKRLFHARIDLPFALPQRSPASRDSPVSEMAGSALPAQPAKSRTPLGIVIAMVFIGLPFVVRTLGPVLEEPRCAEEVAATRRNAADHRAHHPADGAARVADRRGAGVRRAVGEYGSVIFIAGNLQNVSEIAPLLIMPA